VFSLWREGTNTIDRVEKGADRDPDTVFHENKVRLPDEFAGHAMVFRTYDKVSYALVMDSIKPTRVGYHLKHPDAPYSSWGAAPGAGFSYGFRQRRLRPPPAFARPAAGSPPAGLALPRLPAARAALARRWRLRAMLPA